MLQSKKQYMDLLTKVATLLSIPVIPSLEIVLEKFGGTRYKAEIIRLTEEYKVMIVLSSFNRINS